MKITSKLLKPFVRRFFKEIEIKYVELFPIDKELDRLILEETANPELRLSQINSIRTNNIVTTIWAKTGTILGIIITLISFLMTILLALYIPFTFSHEPLYQVVFYFSILVVFYVIYRVLISTIPHLIRRIVFHLPSNEYADISLNSLDKSEMLTFCALRMWNLCNDFKSKIRLPLHCRKLLDAKNKSDRLNYFINNKNELHEDIENLYFNVNKYSAKYTKELNNCISLIKLASIRLNIQERELLNHILKFSPYIFSRRIDSLRSSVSTINFILNSNKETNPNFQTVFWNNLREIGRIRNGIANYSMRSLKQIILYDEIHTCLIGMSSIVSTSRSLKVFCEGMGASLSDRKNNVKYSNKYLRKDIDVCVEKFKSIIHRSKAHYGMDLLVLLENFCKEKSGIGNSLTKIPEAIFKIKYPNRIKKRNLSGYFNGYDDVAIIDEIQDDIFHLRNNMIVEYSPAIEEIKSKFIEKLLSINPVDGRVYLCLFGYSRIVRNVLKSFASEIYDLGVITFVIKEDSDEMIDTQIYRFELNDDKPEYNLRRTFTASDDFFKRILNSNDQLILIGGAEAYDRNCHKLFHTNSYQVRIERLLNFAFEEIKIPTHIWILAGNYKVFEEFPDRNSLFGYEFYSDHYDKIDLYDFYKYRENVTLIHN